MRHEIDVPGLPEGWKAVAYRKAKKGEWNFMEDGDPFQASQDHGTSSIIVEKIQPHRVVLEDILHEDWCQFEDGGERGLTTFRERVINDLVHNRIISTVNDGY